jgi:biopolymer transport protein ExbD
MIMKFKRQRKEALAVNLTPLIDVVFLLLIFFMVSTSFTDLSELVVNLPEADGEQRQAETKGLELVITASEEMFLNGVPFPADEKNLRLILVEKAGSRRDIPISIIADADTRHAMVVMSMDAVSQLGFKQLSIVTQKPLLGD